MNNPVVSFQVPEYIVGADSEHSGFPGRCHNPESGNYYGRKGQGSTGAILTYQYNTFEPIAHL